MITIALDENGDFEGSKNSGESTPLYIAGIVYDDGGNDKDTKYEMQRLDEYFRAVASEKADGDSVCCYPQDLHVNNQGVNNTNVRRMKSRLGESLPEFIQYGTYKNKKIGKFPRQGQYRITMMLKSNTGKTILNHKSTSNLINDGYASNLYVNMAYSIVSRLVFHNPYNLHVTKVKFDLATRLVPVKASDQELCRNYLSLGYKDYKFDPNRAPADYKNGTMRYFQVANDSNYRTALDLKLLETNRLDLESDWFSVRSIYYGADEKTSIKYTFLYLADVICSIFNHKKTGDNITKWQQSFVEQAKQLTGSSQNLIFMYDDIDMDYEAAVMAYQQKDYYKVLTTLFKSKHSNSNFTSYYWKQWFPKIEEWINNIKDKEAIEEAVRQFAKYANSNLLKQDELVYLYNHLEPLVANLEIFEASKYAFYDAGITAYNHIGNSQMAERCFEIAKGFAKYCHVEDYLLTLKRRVVMLNDQYRYKEALSLAKEILEYEDELASLRELLVESGDVSSISKGRALSLCGQVYAYMRDSQAENCFKEALDQFDEQSIDYNITLSYLLHYYIDMGIRESYERYAPIYFGGHNDVWNQFKYLKDMTEDEQKQQSFKFAFYVYIKALYTFYLDQLNSEKRRDLFKWVQNLPKSSKSEHLNGHPWELIYKYFALIAVTFKKQELADECIQLTQTVVQERAAAIDNIIAGGLVEYYTLVGKSDMAEQAKELFTNNEIREHYKELLVYMFR